MNVSELSVESLRPFLEALFEAAGVPKEDASVVTDAFLEANLRGVDTHGVRLIPAYVRRLQQGGVNPVPEIRIISDLGGTVRLDGDHGLGQVVGCHAMRTAIERASEHGIAMVVAGNTSHIGAASYYTRMALEQRMAGFATSNNLPSLFVWGGLKRAISNPPFSVSFPSRRTPFVLDICLGTVAWNKIYMRLQNGEDIPEGWAWDPEGRPTTDPGRAAEGSIIPIGGHKGSSLTLAVDLFTGVLGGFAFADQVGALLTNDRDPENSSCLMMAIDVSRILGPEVLDRAERLIEWCKDSPLAAGFSEILMPGEPEESIRRSRLRQGIPVSKDDLRALAELGESMGVEVPF
ncbi:MAG: Ldh family oxidoreductase [Spirochaetales bacterium]|nr:Ldh family oxidoreductase [Spirochaetales bacterium]